MADELPPNATPLERALSNATARLGAVPVPVGDLWNPSRCPAAALPWLAWALSVDVWDSAWSEAQQRSAIQQSIFIHRHKGTRAALEAALEAVSYLPTITEWHEPAGVAAGMAPYTFTIGVDVAGDSVPAEAVAQINRIVERAKNVRSSFALTVRSQSFGTIGVAGAAIAGMTITIQAGD